MGIASIAAARFAGLKCKRYRVKDDREKGEFSVRRSRLLLARTTIATLDAGDNGIFLPLRRRTLRDRSDVSGC